jgi:uncharacterized protein
MQAPSPAGPVGASDRVELIDILRGVAVFGILAFNMQLYFSPLLLMASHDTWWTSPLDRIVELAIQLFVQGKFYTLFSFLFGVGVALQFERAREQGRDFAPLYVRRLGWLLVIGLVHAFGIWFGDILVTYAVFGFLLLLFRNQSYKALTLWAGALLLMPLGIFALFTVIVEIASFVPESAATIEASFAESAGAAAEAILRARQVYANGTFVEILRERAGQVGWIYSSTFLLGFGLNILGLFLIGLQVGRRRWLQEAYRHLPAARRLMTILLPVGLTGALMTAVASAYADRPLQPSAPGLIAQLGATFGVPALSFGYVCAITLLFHHARFGRFLTPLAAVGRMALTNYLTHSILMTLLANAYGLGLYGKVYPAAGLLMTVALYALQILFSNWWLARFRFGPAEWIWRNLTYGSGFRRACR